MRRRSAPRLPRAAAALLAALLAPLVSGCTRGPAGPGGSAVEPVVRASTWPLEDAARAMLGGAVEVRGMLPPGADPAHRAPDRDALRALQRARLIVLNGAGLEAWAETASLPRSRTVETSAGFAGRLLFGEQRTHSHGPGGPHSHGDLLPWTWVDPNNLSLQVGALAEALVAAFPGARDAIGAGRAAYQEQLRGLDRGWLLLVPRLEGTRLFATDARYAYLADRYRLSFELLEVAADGGPSPDASARVREALLQDRPAQLWIEPDRSAAWVGLYAGLELVEFPTLGARPADADEATYPAAARAAQLRLARLLGVDDPHFESAHDGR